MRLLLLSTAAAAAALASPALAQDWAGPYVSGLIGYANAEELARRAVAQNLSVREVEKLVRRGDAPDIPRRTVRVARDPAKDADIAAVQRHLEEFLGLGVKIKTDADPRSGAVIIRYRTLDQLDLICQRLTGGDI